MTIQWEYMLEPIEMDDFIDRLNALGLQGWELCSEKKVMHDFRTEPGKQEYYRCLLKRKK